MKIMQNSMLRQFELNKEEYEARLLEALRSGWYILGKEVSAFEDEFSAYVGAKHCVGLANGLDALSLAFRTLGIGSGDEVIVQANAYIACVIGITMNGASPVFVEPDEYLNLNPSGIESKITPKTKAILAVHLFGQPCRMTEICSIAKKHEIFVIEDCAQSHGALFDGKMTGTFGDISCFSFYPSKNLGAFGDAGAIVTDNESYAKRIRMLRNYGSEKRYYNVEAGVNSRLDELQAALLRVKLSHLDEFNRERHKICQRYLDGIKNPLLSLPLVHEKAYTVWHQFVLRSRFRDALASFLEKNGISTIIHYPIPPHLSEAYAHLGFKRGDFPIAEEQADQVLSLPLFNGMTGEEIEFVIDSINNFSA